MKWSRLQKIWSILKYVVVSMAKKKGKLDKKAGLPSKSINPPASSGVIVPDMEQKLPDPLKLLPQGKEALKIYIETAGQKCLDLFKYLSTSQQWYNLLFPAEIVIVNSDSVAGDNLVRCRR